MREWEKVAGFHGNKALTLFSPELRVNKEREGEREGESEGSGQGRAKMYKALEGLILF